MNTPDTHRPLSVPFPAIDALLGIDRLDNDAQVEAAVREVAAPVTAGELRRLAAETWNRNLVSVADLRDWLLARADQIDGGGDPE